MTASAATILAAIRISAVYRALTGVEPRRTGADTFRVRAAWRNGDGPNVALDDSRGVWHDFVTDEGGGVLDLIVRVHGGTRQEALRWAADYAGVSLDDNKLSPAERAEWAKKRKELEQHLPDARYWLRAAINMTEDLLPTLKAALFDPTLPQPETGEIYQIERMLASLRAAEGAALVALYLAWLADYPGTISAMVRAAKARERVERHALSAYLRTAQREREGAA